MGNKNDDDIVIENDSDLDDSVLADEHQGDTIKKLKEKLKDAEGKAKENMDGWQRAQADFINLRKRDEEAKMDFLKYANSALMTELIPVLDSFTLAEAHPGADLLPLHKQLINILKSNGLEEINPLGEKFDPSFHEAIGMIKTDKPDEDHKILEVLQKGYIMNGKSLRPAKVKVGEFTN